MLVKKKANKNLSESLQIDIFLEMMAAERGASINTITAYLRDLKEFEVFMLRRNRNIESADSKNIQNYLAQLKINDRASTTRARKLSVLKQFYQFLYAERQRSDDPSARIDGPITGRPLPKYLSENEVEMLLEAARGQLVIRYLFRYDEFKFVTNDTKVQAQLTRYLRDYLISHSFTTWSTRFP